MRLFEEFDGNQTGSLTRVDCLRIPVEKMSAKAGGTVGEQFDVMDADKDGQISFAELFAHADITAGEAVPPADAGVETVEAAVMAEQLAEQEQVLMRKSQTVEAQAAALAQQQAALDTQSLALARKSAGGAAGAEPFESRNIEKDQLVKNVAQAVAQVTAHMSQKAKRGVTLGDDSTDAEIGKMVRQSLCDALVPVLNYGFKSFKLFGKHHFYDFLEKVTTNSRILHLVLSQFCHLLPNFKRQAG